SYPAFLAELLMAGATTEPDAGPSVESRPQGVWRHVSMRQGIIACMTSSGSESDDDARIGRRSRPSGADRQRVGCN
ncbi:MAG: hypothetical protein ACRDRL_01505, partial [Sciscionella sp.]